MNFLLYPNLERSRQAGCWKTLWRWVEDARIARALIPKPKQLMLDEPSLGLSPKSVRSFFEKIVQINAETSATFLIVDQKVREVLEICQRVYSIKLGIVSFEGQPGELQEDKEKLKGLFL
ncbi:MAG: hypothetical protein HN356_01585 [Calditrichaeota bacterium]|nr:hypothetical protein [Calditrichota bacterium]MBT7615886.1 hypothetical protein [Calditrichota bacterium]MBT7788156.1 hypothetical protein [Calditrichota bacterium]